jgi:hypothetical protein
MAGRRPADFPRCSVPRKDGEPCGAMVARSPRKRHLPLKRCYAHLAIALVDVADLLEAGSAVEARALLEELIAPVEK